MQQYQSKAQLSSLQMDFDDISIQFSQISLSTQGTQMNFRPSQRPQPKSNQIEGTFFCHAGHTLKKFYDSKKFIICDSCDQKGFDAGSYVLSCRGCDYDICIGCARGYERQKMQNPTIDQGYKMCTQGHYLTVNKIKFQNNTYCDFCCQLAGGYYTLKCRFCNFDICGDCESQYQKQKILKCPRRHPLVLNFERIKSNVCDYCKLPCIRQGGCAMTCEQCDFDICVECKKKVLSFIDL